MSGTREITAPSALTLEARLVACERELAAGKALLSRYEAEEREREQEATRAAARRRAMARKAWFVFREAGPIIVVVAGLLAMMFHLFAALDLLDEKRAQVLKLSPSPATETFKLEPSVAPPPITLEPDSGPSSPREWMQEDEHPFGDSPSRL